MGVLWFMVWPITPKVARVLRLRVNSNIHFKETFLTLALVRLHMTTDLIDLINHSSQPAVELQFMTIYEKYSVKMWLEQHCEWCNKCSSYPCLCHHLYLCLKSKMDASGMTPHAGAQPIIMMLCGSFLARQCIISHAAPGGEFWSFWRTMWLHLSKRGHSNYVCWTNWCAHTWKPSTHTYMSKCMTTQR